MTSKNASSKSVGNVWMCVESMESKTMRAEEAIKKSHGIRTILAGRGKESCQLSRMAVKLYWVNLSMLSEYLSTIGK